MHGWASCSITQNGFVRIISQPRYPNPVPPYQALERLAQATNTEHHRYWTCSISLTDDLPPHDYPTASYPGGDQASTVAPG